MCSPTRSARSETPSRLPFSSVKRSTNTSRSMSFWETCRGRRRTGCPARDSRRVSLPTSTSIGPAGARPHTAAGASTRCSIGSPAIEMEIVFRVQRLIAQPPPSVVEPAMPETSPLIGNERMERAGLTVEIGHLDGTRRRPRIRDRSDLRGPLRTRRGNPRRRRQHPARRAFRCPRRMDLVNAREARRPPASASARPTTPASNPPCRSSSVSGPSPSEASHEISDPAGDFVPGLDQ